jgi:hypothetical protein
MGFHNMGDENKPTRPEVEQQLQRMLESDIFAACPRQAALFEFLVKGAIEGQEITQKDIRARFFPTPPYKPESTVARTTVTFIRKKLVRAYYKTRGEEDLVIIDLPQPANHQTSGKRIKTPTRSSL